MPVRIKDTDKGWKALRKELEKASRGNKPHVTVGIHERMGGAPHAKSTMTVAEIATIHEFGAPGANIPERSFLRGTVDAKREQIKQMTSKLAAAVVDGKQTVAGALNLIGLGVVGMVKQRIADGIEPPLQERTIARKGSSKPLIDTGQMRNSIDHEVHNS